MKTYIKVYWFLLVFFAVVSSSYCQTLSSQENTQQNNSNTDIEQQTNSGTDVNQQTIDETSGNQTLDVAGEIQPENENPAVVKNESLTTSPTKDNINTTNVVKASVKGKRTPNEFPSGRSGGQYANTGVSYQKITSPRELEKRSAADNPISGNKSTADKSSGTTSKK